MTNQKSRKRWKLKKDARYTVKWNDAYSSSGWSDESDIMEVMDNGFPIETLGFYIGEKNGYMAFAQDIKRIEPSKTHGKYGQVFAVPSTWVQTVKEVR